MTKRVDSAEDLDGTDVLDIPDRLRMDTPSDSVAWLIRNFGHKYEFEDPAGLIEELASSFAKRCSQEWAQGTEVV